MDDQVVPAHRVLETTGELLELPFEPLVLEGRHPPTDLADGVMVVLATGHDRLVPCGALAELDSLDEAHLVQELERSVDARQADAAPRAMKLVGDLVG